MSNYPHSRQEDIDRLIKKSNATVARSPRQNEIDRSIIVWKTKNGRRVGEQR